jgi:hypothetical protein
MLIGTGEVWTPGLLSFSKVGGVALFTMTAAYLFARLFEDRTDVVRETLDSFVVLGISKLKSLRVRLSFKHSESL